LAGGEGGVQVTVMKCDMLHLDIIIFI